MNKIEFYIVFGFLCLALIGHVLVFIVHICKAKDNKKSVNTEERTN